jgi:quinolinate synthase
VRKDIELYDGTCYVHEEYQPESVDQVRKNFSGVEILAHPECRPDVVDKADYVGSTSGMLNYVRKSCRKTFFLLTECGLTGILESEFPDKQFVGTCTTCRYMKANSLENILNALEKPTSYNVIELDSKVQKNALSCVEKMFSYAEG